MSVIVVTGTCDNVTCQCQPSTCRVSQTMTSPLVLWHMFVRLCHTCTTLRRALHTVKHHHFIDYEFHGFKISSTITRHVLHESQRILPAITSPHFCTESIKVHLTYGESAFHNEHALGRITGTFSPIARSQRCNAISYKRKFNFHQLGRNPYRGLFGP